MRELDKSEPNSQPTISLADVEARMMLAVSLSRGKDVDGALASQELEAAIKLRDQWDLRHGIERVTPSFIPEQVDAILRQALVEGDLDPTESSR
jgi:hypothetical protein